MDKYGACQTQVQMDLIPIKLPVPCQPTSTNVRYSWFAALAGVGMSSKAGHGPLEVLGSSKVSY